MAGGAIGWFRVPSDAAWRAALLPQRQHDPRVRCDGPRRPDTVPRAGSTRTPRPLLDRGRALYA